MVKMDYIGVFSLGIILISLSFIPKVGITWQSILISSGASFFTAAIVALLVDLINYKNEDNKRNSARENELNGVALVTFHMANELTNILNGTMKNDCAVLDNLNKVITQKDFNKSDYNIFATKVYYAIDSKSQSVKKHLAKILERAEILELLGYFTKAEIDFIKSSIYIYENMNKDERKIKIICKNLVDFNNYFPKIFTNYKATKEEKKWLTQI